MAMLAYPGRLLPLPAAQAVIEAIGGYWVCSPLLAMDTNCQKRLELLDMVFLHGSGSRKAAAGAVVWFTQTTHGAFEGL